MYHRATGLARRFPRALPLLCAMVLVLLTACGRGERAQVYDVEQNGRIFTVDQANQTITVDGHICQFAVSGGGDNVDFNVTYPDGSTYWWRQGGSFGYGGGRGDYDPDRYAAGDVLWDVLSQEPQTDGSRSGRYAGLGLLLILLGAVSVALPRAMWYVGYGWRYKNAEPSDGALFAERAGGAVAILAGVIFLFV